MGNWEIIQQFNSFNAQDAFSPNFLFSLFHSISPHCTGTV